MTPQSTLTAANFQALVLEETAVVDQFIVVLTREEQALTGSHADQLSSLAAEKSEYCSRLEHISRNRLLMCASAGMAATPSGLASWLKAQPKTLGDSWDTLLLKAGEARSLNRRNGEIIRIHMQHNRQALTVLLEVADRAAVYGPDGQPRPSTGGRILGKC